METTRKPNYVEELLEIFRSPLSAEELRDQISDYHESDIADAFEQLSVEERKKLYPLLGAEWVAEIFSYIEDPDEYLQELNLDQDVKLGNMIIRPEKEEQQILRILGQTGNNRTLAARILGISRTALYYKLKKYGIV